MTTATTKTPLAAPTGRIGSITPTENRIIVEQLDAQEKIGSFHIPDSAREKPKVGQVMAIGPDVKHIQEEDWVAFEAYAGTTLEVFGRSVMVMPEDQVLLVIKVASA